MDSFNIEDGVLLQYVGSSSCVVIPDTVTEMASWAFDRCSAVTELFIPASVEKIEYRAIASCPSLRRITVDDENPYYKSVNGDLYTRSGDVLLNYSVGKTAEVFVVPDGVVNIADGAFWGCQSLISVVIPNGVQCIGAGAFSFCSLLTSVRIPSGIRKIGNAAFSGCRRLCEIVIPDSIETIGFHAFDGCAELKRVVVPNSVRSVGAKAFNGIPQTAVLHLKLLFIKVVEDFESESAWAAAVRGYLTRYFSGETDEDERKIWRQYVGKRSAKAFRLLSEEPMLYKYFTEKSSLSPKRVRELIEETENVECRAILMDYANKCKNKKKSAEEVIDSLLALDDQ